MTICIIHDDAHIQASTGKITVAWFQYLIRDDNAYIEFDLKLPSRSEGSVMPLA